MFYLLYFFLFCGYCLAVFFLWNVTKGASDIEYTGDMLYTV